VVVIDLFYLNGVLPSILHIAIKQCKGSNREVTRSISSINGRGNKIILTKNFLHIDPAITLTVMYSKLYTCASIIPPLGSSTSNWMVHQALDLVQVDVAEQKCGKHLEHQRGVLLVLRQI
jgi:hypothetical protein